MLKTNSKKAIGNLKKYIVENTNFTEYGFKQETEFEKCAQYIMTYFYIEKVKFDQRKLPFEELFIEWLQGLPTPFNSLYYYNRYAKDDLQIILEETDNEKEKYSENAACNLLSKLIYREILKACDYKVKTFDEWM